MVNCLLPKYGEKNKKENFDILIQAFQKKLLSIAFPIRSCLALINYK